MNQSNNNSSGGISIGFSGLLTIVFIVLKLCGVIDWAWGWVLAPIWITAALAVVVFVVALIYVCVRDRHEISGRK